MTQGVQFVRPKQNIRAFPGVYTHTHARCDARVDNLRPFVGSVRVFGFASEVHTGVLVWMCCVCVCVCLHIH